MFCWTLKGRTPEWSLLSPEVRQPRDRVRVPLSPPLLPGHSYFTGTSKNFQPPLSSLWQVIVLAGFSWLLRPGWFLSTLLVKQEPSLAVRWTRPQSTGEGPWWWRWGTPERNVGCGRWVAQEGRRYFFPAAKTLLYFGFWLSYLSQTFGRKAVSLWNI